MPPNQETNGRGVQQGRAEEHRMCDQTRTTAILPVLTSNGKGELKAPQLTQAAADVLLSPPAPMIVPVQAIRRALMDKANVNESVTELAIAQFDGDQDRKTVRVVARTALAAIHEMLQGASEDRDSWHDLFRHAPRLRYTPISNPFSLWQRVPAIVLLMFWLLLFCFGLFAEIRNGLFLVQGAGIGFFDDPLGAVCFAGVYTLAPLVVFKFLSRRLNGADQETFRRRLKWIALPSVIVGIGLFGLKMGLMHEAMDVFSGSDGWQPPLWMLITTSCFLLAVVVLILPFFIADALEHLWRTEPVETPVYQVSLDCFNRRKDVLKDWHALRTYLEQLLEEQRNEKAAFVQSCLSELKRAKAELSSRTHQIMRESLLSESQ